MRAATLSALLLLPVVCQDGGPLGEDEFEPDESLGSPTTLGSSVADDLSSQARLAEFLADDEKMRAINRRIEEGDHGFDPFYGIDPSLLYVGVPGDFRPLQEHGWQFAPAPKPAKELAALRGSAGASAAPRREDAGAMPTATHTPRPDGDGGRTSQSAALARLHSFLDRYRLYLDMTNNASAPNASAPDANLAGSDAEEVPSKEAPDVPAAAFVQEAPTAPATRRRPRPRRYARPSELRPASLQPEGDFAGRGGGARGGDEGGGRGGGAAGRPCADLLADACAALSRVGSDTAATSTPEEPAGEGSGCVFGEDGALLDQALPGCTVDACRDHRSLEAASRACTEYGPACGGVTRTAAGEYQTRGRARAVHERGATTWEQKCADGSDATRGGVEAAAAATAAANATGGDPCAVYADAVGERRWRATRQALLALLHKRGQCAGGATGAARVPAAASLLGSALRASGAAKTPSAHDTSLFSSGEVMATMSELKSRLEAESAWADEPPEVRRLPTGDGAFRHEVPLANFLPLKDWKKSFDDIGEVRDVPWRTSLNCSCILRPPGKCQCVQYAECTPKVDDENILASVSSAGKQASERTLPFRQNYINQALGQIGPWKQNTEWVFPEPRPMPLVFTLLQEEEGRGGRRGDRARELEAQLEAALDEPQTAGDRAELLQMGEGSSAGGSVAMTCQMSKLLCNCSHSCKCTGELPDKHTPCPIPNMSPPQKTRVACTDGNLENICARYLSCLPSGQVGLPNEIVELVNLAGLGFTQRCWRECHCESIVVWGLLWV